MFIALFIMKNTRAKNHKEMYLNSICAGGAGSNSSTCNDTTQGQKNTVLELPQ